MRNNSIAAVSDFHHGTAMDDLEWFGYDSEPVPGDDSVREVDPLEYSDSFGIDVYLKALSTILTAISKWPCSSTHRLLKSTTSGVIQVRCCFYTVQQPLNIHPFVLLICS